MPPCSASERRLLDGDVFAALVFVWIVNVIRVAAAVLKSEPLGQEVVLALVLVLVLPWTARVNLGGGWRSR